MFRSRLAFAAFIALLVPVAGASASVDTVGSDLTGSAGTAIQRTEDTALAQLSGARAAVGTSGQVLSVEVKGCSMKGNVPQNPETALFVQDLRGSGGNQEVISSSQQFHLPICGAGADQNTVSTFRPQDQCVTAGDMIGLVVGGQTPGYPQGTPYFIAKAAAGSGLGAFSKNFGAVIGSHINLDPLANTELMMQAKVGSGSDSPSRCPGGDSGGGGGGGGGGGQPPKGGISAAVLEVQQGSVATIRRGRGDITASCALPSGQTCAVSLVAGIGRKGATRVGTMTGSIAGGSTNVLALRLNRTGKRTLAQRKKMTVILRGTLRGGGGTANLTRKLPVRSG